MNDYPESSMVEAPEETAKFTCTTFYTRQIMDEFFEISRNAVAKNAGRTNDRTPKKLNIITRSIILIVAFTALIYYFFSDYPLPLVLFFLTPWIFFSLLVIFIYRRKPTDQQYATSTALLQNGQTIHLYNEYLHTTISQPGYSSSTSIYYSMLDTIIETPSHFFYLFPNTTYSAVDKAGFSDDTRAEAIEFIRNAVPLSKYTYYTPSPSKKAKN